MKRFATILISFLTILSFACPAQNIDSTTKVQVLTTKADSTITLRRIKINVLKGIGNMLHSGKDKAFDFQDITCYMNNRVLFGDELRACLNKYESSATEVKKWKNSSDVLRVGYAFAAWAVVTPVLVPFVWFTAATKVDIVQLFKFAGYFSLGAAIVSIPPFIIGYVLVKRHIKRAIDFYNMEVRKRNTT